MAKKTQEKKEIAPYIPFLTLKNLVATLKSTTIPPVIDSSVLRNMSGSMRSQVMSALRFLNLIDENDKVQEGLKRLVNAYETDGWKSVLGGLITPAYVVMELDFDRSSGTSSQINEAFRKNGNVEGQMLEKAVRFYLAALKEADIPFSPHFVTMGARTSGRTAPRRIRLLRKLDVDQDEQEEQDFSDLNIAKFRIPIPGKRGVVIAVPTDIDEADWTMVKAMLDAYVQRLTK